MDARVEQVEEVMRVIGGRWKPAIMFALIMDGTKRFSDLRQLMPRVSSRILTKQLRELEDHGLVAREVFAEVPLRVQYTATDRGRSLHVVYKTVCDWATANWSQAKRQAATAQPSGSG